VQGSVPLPAGAKLDLQQLLPSNQSYISYAGSLTTPPCTEGVLWLMLLNTQKISLQQVGRASRCLHVYFHGIPLEVALLLSLCQLN
jgi:carbonic anhydrase